MERLTLYTHLTDLGYLRVQLAAHYGPVTQTGPLDWLARPPPQAPPARPPAHPA